jgi:hypothetical protein
LRIPLLFLFNFLILIPIVDIQTLSGLALELFIEQHEYVPELVEAAGIRVNIGTQNIMPFPEDNGIFAQPGTLTSIGLRRVSDKNS